MPEYMERLLFDDIPYLKIAQREHDYFAELLRQHGVETVYLTDLTAEALTKEKVRENFVREYLQEAGIRDNQRMEIFMDYLLQMNTKNMVEHMICGLRKTEIQNRVKKNLTDYLSNDYPFFVDPMPNLYFTRDPFATIGHGITLNKMNTRTRNRETLLAKYIFQYHPKYRGTPVYYDRIQRESLEGGDLLILNQETVAIGISQRTHPNAIEQFAKKLLTEDSTFQQVLAVDIPKTRSFMHLDTVFTMVDRNTFTIHPNISNNLHIFVITLKYRQLQIQEETGTLEDILKKYLNLDQVTLLPCGNGSIIDAAREQWNDGSNTLAIAPGKVIVYARNHITNEILRQNGLEVLEIPSSELSRGRGGPRCMSMPLIRDRL